MNPIEFGKFIANLRNEKQLTQEDLADKLFIDKRKISRWECGTSIPEFEMLIKLSEILDVSLYELSICQRIEKEKISRKILNKFKNIKDIKKYNAKKKLVYLLLLILLVFFIITTIYTIKYYGTIEIYELESIDNKYRIEGYYIKENNNSILNITKSVYDENADSTKDIIDNCDCKIYSDDFQIINYINPNINIVNSINMYSKINIIKHTKNTLTFKSICYDNKKSATNYEFKFKLVKKYDNKFF